MKYFSWDATPLPNREIDWRNLFSRQWEAFPRSRGTLSLTRFGRRRHTAIHAPAHIATTPAGCCRCLRCRASGAGFSWDATGKAVPPGQSAGKTRPVFLGCHHPLRVLCGHLARQSESLALALSTVCSADLPVKYSSASFHSRSDAASAETASISQASLLRCASFRKRRSER